MSSIVIARLVANVSAKRSKKIENAIRFSRTVIRDAEAIGDMWFQAVLATQVYLVDEAMQMFAEEV